MNTWRWKRALLIAEVVICFSPFLFSLVLGIFALPSLILQMLWYGVNTLPFIAMIIGGVAGVGGIVLLLEKYARRDTTPAGRRAIIACLVSGFAAYLGFISPLMWSDPDVYELTLYALPVLCAAHVLYETRTVLFGSIE